MKKTTYFLAIAFASTLLLNSCGKKDDGTTTGKISENRLTPFYNLQTKAYLQAGFTDLQSHAIGIIATFHPHPEKKTKTFTINLTPPESEADKVSIEYSVDTDKWVALSGSATLTVLPSPSDSAYFKFENVTFKLTGKPNRVISGWIGFKM
jgi:hypothetical protein